MSKIATLKASAVWLVGVAVVVASLGVTAEANAQGARVYMTELVGYKGQVPELAREQIARTTRERLDADPAVQLAAPIESGVGLDTGNTALIEATRLYEIGRSQAVDLRFDEAASNLGTALEYIDANVADVEDWNLVENVLFRLSYSLFSIEGGDTAAAEPIMRRLIAFNPGREILADEVISEAYAARYAELKAETEKRSPGSIDTSTVAPGAEIWIDGVIRGATPMTVGDIGAGNHFVVVKTDAARWGSVVAVEPSATVTISADLDSGDSTAPDAALVSDVGDGTVGNDETIAARNLANKAATDYVVTGLIVPVDDTYVVQAFVYNVELGTLRALEPVDFDEDLLKLNVSGYALAAEISKGVNDPTVGEVLAADTTYTPKTYAKATSTVKAEVTPGIDAGLGTDTGTETGTGTGTGTGDTMITGIPDEDDGDAWYTNAWLWTGVGAVVLAGGITAIVLATADEGQTNVTGFNATIEW